MYVCTRTDARISEWCQIADRWAV